MTFSKVDLNALTPEERAHYEKFGMLPKKSLASAMLEKRKEVGCPTLLNPLSFLFFASPSRTRLKIFNNREGSSSIQLIGPRI